MFYFLIDFYCFMKTEKNSALFRCLCTWLCTFLSDFIFVPAKQIVFRKSAAKITEAVLDQVKPTKVSHLQSQPLQGAKLKKIICRYDPSQVANSCLLTRVPKSNSLCAVIFNIVLFLASFPKLVCRTESVGQISYFNGAKNHSLFALTLYDKKKSQKMPKKNHLKKIKLTLLRYFYICFWVCHLGLQLVYIKVYFFMIKWARGNFWHFQFVTQFTYVSRQHGA